MGANFIENIFGFDVSMGHLSIVDVAQSAEKLQNNIGIGTWINGDACFYLFGDIH